MSPGELAEAIRGGEKAGGEINYARPDVQPAAIEALRPAIWTVSNIVATQSVGNILRYDGGDGKRTGQVAADLDANVRLTAEMDLLLSTESTEVLRLYDWKTGRGTSDIGDVKDAFQFQFYCWLLFQEYPGVNRVDVVVANTREGRALPPVHFYRSKLPEYLGRITTAVNAWTDNEEPVPLEKVAAWPSVEKCRLCDAAVDCPVAEREVAMEPVGVLLQVIALDARRDKLEELLKAAVTKSGGPIRTPEGDCYGKFGAEKPRETFKVKAATNKGD
jgi:hypothetical protein